MTTTMRLGKASAKVLTIGLAAMGLALGATALATKSHPAYAYTPKAGGQPGETQVPVLQGASSGGLPEITFPTRYVWRSNAYAGTQVITVTYRLWKYNAGAGSWSLYLTSVRSAQLTSDAIGSWVSGWSTPVQFDHYTVNFQVNWTTLDGSLFGWKVIDYNTPSDYQCLTATRCAVYHSGDVGAFIYFSPPAPKPVATSQPTKAPTQSAGGTSVTIPGGSDPAYRSAGTDGSSGSGTCNTGTSRSCPCRTRAC